MTNLIVRGGRPLRGEITPSANKNAVLPILCGSLLTREPVRLRGITTLAPGQVAPPRQVAPKPRPALQR